MDDYPDCNDCRSMTSSYHAKLCLAENLPKPVSYMRDPRSSCGPEKRLFDPKPEAGSD